MMGTESVGDLPEWWSVVGNNDKLGLSLAQGFQGLFVAQTVLARFHHQSQTLVDVLRLLLQKQKNISLTLVLCKPMKPLRLNFSI